MCCVRALAYTKPESFLSFFFAVFYVREQYVSTTCKRKQFSVHSHFGANNSSGTPRVLTGTYWCNHFHLGN